MPKVLVVDDEESLLEAVRYALSREGLNVVVARDGAEAVQTFETERPDLIVLDLMLPVLTGIDVCRRIRAASQVPILMLTARDGEVDRVVGLEMGADDYVTKPFSLRELVARVRALLRRAEGRRGQGVMRVGELTIDPATRAVRLAGRRIELSAKEFALLHALAEQPTRVYGKQELLRDVWGYLSLGKTRTLDAHACRLRKKLRGPGRPWVVNVRGVGYKLTEAL
jgi:DNA-binding response OmpR family regulator